MFKNYEMVDDKYISEKNQLFYLFIHSGDWLYMPVLR